MLRVFPRSLFRHAPGVLVALLCAINAAAAAPKATRAKSIEIQYVPPKSDALKPIYDYVRESKGLEKVQAVLRPVRLPRRLLIKTESCDGDSNVLDFD